MTQRAVFLDRDGVINAYACDREFGTIDSPARPEEFVLLPGAAEATARLKREGFLIIVVSNQPGIAKGRFTPALLESVTERMKGLVGEAGGVLDAVYYCPHHPEGSVEAYRQQCECRKPGQGLFLQAASEWGIDLSHSYTVGDGVVDIVAGRAVGTRTIYVGPRKCYLCSELTSRDARPDGVAASLEEATDLICNWEKGRGVRPKGNGEVASCLYENGSDEYASRYVQEAIEILKQLDPRAVERIAELLASLRSRGGRLFCLGVGGGAGHASHAVCDFRKIAGLEAYAPSDNVSELTARVNDDGWDTAYANWLRGSRLGANDMVFIFSVGGGDAKKNISANLVRALDYAREAGATICGIVGRDGGYTAQVAHACVLVPVVNPATVTPHTESFQALVWHLLVSHPKLKQAEMKWESVEPAAKT